MAHISALDEVDPKLRSYLLSTLRVQDEAVLLPRASRSVESFALKNVVLRLSGDEGGLDHGLFSSNWFAGVTVLALPRERTEALLRGGQRAKTLEVLAKTPSEMTSPDLQVGPELDCDQDGKDLKEWTSGFDGVGSCLGIYSAIQTKASTVGTEGMQRGHEAFFLVCKAGGGLSAQTFHARLVAALKGGATLDEALSEKGTPGAAALRRVASAARRNRGRTLLAAAEELGFYTLDSVSDMSAMSSTRYRVPIPVVDVSYNVLSRVTDAAPGKSLWKYTAGCVDTAVSTAVCTSSNVHSGFVLHVAPDEGARVHVRNDAHCAVNFSSTRLKSNRDVVLAATEAHRKAAPTGKAAHPDSVWVKSRFAWTSKDFGSAHDIEPAPLWGTHGSECVFSEWARELGVARLTQVRLHPEAVALSAVEPGKLRVALRSLDSK
jgi:hypothetical protein